MVGVLGARSGAFGRATFFEIIEPVAEHAHPHVHVLFKAGGGDRRMLVEGVEHKITSTACLLIDPWRKHADFPEQSDETTRVLALYIEPAWMAQRFGLAAMIGFDSTSVETTSAINALVAQVGEVLSGADVAEDEFEALVADLVGETCLAHLIDRYQIEASDYRIRHALRRLREKPRLHVDFADLARGVGLSRSRFYEQFRSSVGVAPNMFVDGLVLEQAYSMMCHTGRPLDEIASSLGFSTQSSFTRFFRDRVGFPPSTVRRQIDRRG